MVKHKIKFHAEKESKYNFGHPLDVEILCQKGIQTQNGLKAYVGTEHQNIVVSSKLKILPL